MDPTYTPASLSMGLAALAQAVEQSPVSIVITDTKGTIEYVNPFFTRVTGYERYEALGENPRILKTGYTTQEEYRSMFQHLESGRIWRGEFRNRRKDGTLYWEEAVVVPVRDPDGTARHYLALKQDITARREAEHAREAMLGLLHLCNREGTRAVFLRSTVEYLRGLAEVARVRLRVGDGPWASEFTEFTAERTDRTVGAESLLFSLEHGGRRLGRLEFWPGEGQAVAPVEVNLWRELAAPIAVALAKHLSEEALRESEQRYRDVQKMEAIGQLAGGVAHDYNNILTATLLHLALLRETPGLPAKVLATVDELETEARRAAKLTRQLLLFSRRQPGRMERIDVRAIAGGLHPMLQRILGEDIELEFPRGTGGAWIDGDAGMMEQVLVNLCVNARDAMEPQGGRITVRIEPVTLTGAEPMRSAKARAGNFICIRVSDTGCGMDAETLRHIFEPFFTTKGAARGTGLGLATVYGIMERHQGWIEVESALGRGTEFRLFLPAQPGIDAREGLPSLQQLPRAGGERVLLVEDDPFVRATSSSVLRMHGFEVLDVADARAAEALWPRVASSLNLLVTDLVLPGGRSGRELIMALRERRPDLPVIAMSGYGIGRGGLEVGDLAAVRFLPKPFELQELVRRAHELAARRQGVSS